MWSGKWVVEVANGGSRRMAVTLHFVSELECTQSKISSWDIYLSNFYHLFPVRDQMKALEEVKVKFAGFKGIVDPTDIYGSWATWLQYVAVCGKVDHGTSRPRQSQVQSGTAGHSQIKPGTARYRVIQRACKL